MDEDWHRAKAKEAEALRQAAKEATEALKKAAASNDRQVVVFTHDDRLPEAVRRLDIDATVIEVTRREGSLVDTRRSKDPVSRYLDDAFALAKTEIQ
jgi:rRNA-processing protein FCF1